MKKNIILFIVIVAIILGVIFFIKNHQNSYDFILKSDLKEETTLKDLKEISLLSILDILIALMFVRQLLV